MSIIGRITPRRGKKASKISKLTITPYKHSFIVVKGKNSKNTLSTFFGVI